MKKNIVILLFLVCNNNVYGSDNWDSLFYQLKRNIVRTVSNNIDTTVDFRFSEKNVYVEVSDYRQYSYHFSEGYAGFYARRDSVCNNFRDSTCLKIKNAQGNRVWGYERSVFYDPNIVLWYKMICGRGDHEHAYYKIINDPIEGWGNLENAFFENNRSDSRTYGEVAELIFPIYLYVDEKITSVYMSAVKVIYTKGGIVIKNTILKKAYGSDW